MRRRIAALEILIGAPCEFLLQSRFAKPYPLGMVTLLWSFASKI